MRFIKLAVLAALAIMLCPAGAAGQQARPASAVLSARIDHRLLVSGAQQRATLAATDARGVELRADDWNLYGLMEGMAGGIVPGLVIGVIVGAATSEDGLDGMTSVLTGAVVGVGIGMGVGGIVYTVRRL